MPSPRSAGSDSPTVSDFRYLESLHVERRLTGNGNLFWVSKSYTVQFSIDGIPTLYTVLAGTPTDFASIPPICQGIVQVLGSHVEAAVVHDRLCVDRRPWSSRTAADIFNEATKAADVSTWRRLAMYHAVLLFGPQWD
jgi:hypothetical protein